MKKILRVGHCGIVLLVLSLCAVRVSADEPLREPTIEVADVRLTSVTFSGAQVALLLDVHNPNEIAVTVDAVYYRLEIEGVPPVRGRIVQRETFPAQSARRVRVPVELAYTASLPALLVVLQEPQGTEYAVQGKVKLKDSPKMLEFDHRGKLDIKGLAPPRA